jgi:hypothetical protein
MSNDIFYTNISNLVTFYMGERPSADKFNAVNKYFSRGMRELATAIGDINDDGFPYIGEGEGLGPSWNVYDGGNISRPLDIVSLARLIGPASNLNARMHLTRSLSSEGIQELISSGSSSFKLLYPANGLVLINGFSKIEAEEPFTSSTQYKVNSNREIMFASPITEEATVIYTTDPNQYYGGVDYQNAGFNVIPDPNQNLGVTIESIGDRKYKVTFPKITAQQSGLSSLESSLINTEAEFNNNRYYELPKWLIDSILNDNGIVIEENRIIPGNFLYLKNRETKEVYKDAVYEYESPKELIVSNIDLCEEESGGYSSTKYCVILTGTNITNTLDDLRLKWFKHSHDGRFGESPISFKSLVGKYEVTPPSGVYGPSSNDWNQMPMYLHRDGYSADSNENNGDNAMRGDLMMGVVSFDSINSRTITDSDTTSHSILFGSTSTYIRRINSLLAIVNNGGRISISANDDININAVGGDVNIAADDVNNTCENFNVNASNLINMNSEGVYIERSGVQNSQLYPWKIENNSIEKRAFLNPTQNTYNGVTYVGQPNKRTSYKNINQILNMTKYEKVEYSFYYYTAGEAMYKQHMSSIGVLKNSVEQYYTPTWQNPLRANPSTYKKVLAMDGLASFLNINSLGNSHELTSFGADVKLGGVTESELGDYFWRSNNTKNKVRMKANFSNLSVSSVELKFDTDVLRAYYEIRPWVGHYLLESNENPGTFIGGFNVEDHYVQDLLWMEPTSRENLSPSMRKMIYRFNRWLPWQVEVLGLTDDISDRYTEYKNKFIVSVLNFANDAYEFNALSGDYLQNPSNECEYIFDYSYLFLDSNNGFNEIEASIDGIGELEDTGIQIRKEGLGIVHLKIDVFGVKGGARFLEVEETLIDKSVFLKIKLTHCAAGKRIRYPADHAMTLKSCHEKFVERSIQA